MARVEICVCDHCDAESPRSEFVSGCVQNFFGSGAEDWFGCQCCWDEVEEEDKR